MTTDPYLVGHLSTYAGRLYDEFYQPGSVISRRRTIYWRTADLSANGPSYQILLITTHLTVRRPPMKGGHSPDSVQLAHEFLTALHLRFFQFSKRGTVAIGDTFARQRPEPFAWLQLGGVRWQEDEIQPFAVVQLGHVIPACGALAPVQ